MRRIPSRRTPVTMAALPQYSTDDPNPYFLKRVVELSDQNPVTAHEDIYDVRGIKLLPKGGQVNEEIHERLVRFKLRKPLELSVSTETRLGLTQLCELVDEILDTMGGLARTLAALNADTLARKIIRGIRIDQTSSLYLALQEKESGYLRHALLVALLAIGMGHKHGMGIDTLVQLATSGVLHDVGEIFIDPRILHKTGLLTPEEWRHMACHPIVGALVIRKTLGLPESIAQPVAEHHERMNGYGFPKQLKLPQISPAGALLGAAEQAAVAVAASVSDECSYMLIGMALRMIAGEYHANGIVLAEQMSRILGEEMPVAAPPAKIFDIRLAVGELAASLERARQSLDAASGSPGLSTFVRLRLDIIERALFSTGIDAMADCSEGESFSGTEAWEATMAIDVLRRAVQELPYLATLHAEAGQAQAALSTLTSCCLQNPR